MAEGLACALADSSEPYTTKREGSYTIQFSGREGHISNMPALSVEEFMERYAKKHATRVAMKVERDGKWISWTYKEYLDEVKTAAKAFIKVCCTITVILISSEITYFETTRIHSCWEPRWRCQLIHSCWEPRWRCQLIHSCWEPRWRCQLRPL